jgi:hypothetical protein
MALVAAAVRERQGVYGLLGSSVVVGQAAEQDRTGCGEAVLDAVRVELAKDQSPRRYGGDRRLLQPAETRGEVHPAHRVDHQEHAARCLLPDSGHARLVVAGAARKSDGAKPYRCAHCGTRYTFLANRAQILG